MRSKGNSEPAYWDRKDSEEQLELFFSQSLDGFFFMMLDEPLSWGEGTDKEQALDYAFAHQRITRVNDAMLAQYGATAEQFLGLTPADFYRHNVAYGRQVWRDLFDRGRLHLETEERKLDGSQIWIEGDYICLYDSEGRITGHFGIQRDVTERKHSEQALQRFNRRLQVLQQTNRAILALHSPEDIAQMTVSRLPELVPCVRASVAVFDRGAESATIIALYSPKPTQVGVGAAVPLSLFGAVRNLQEGRVHRNDDLANSPAPGLEALRAEGIRSYSNVPLLADGELIGVLNIASREPGAFGPEHIEIAREFADTLAVAMQQARLCREIEKHAAELEQRVAERTAELAQSESRLRAIACSLPYLVFVVDEDGRYVEVLTGEAHLLYRSPDELKGQLIQDVIPLETARQFHDAITWTIETRKGVILEYQLEVPAGKRWFEGRTAYLPTRIQEKRCIVLTARDITDQKRAEELENQKVCLLDELKAEHNWGEIVGTSQAMQEVFRSIEMVAPTDSTVLLLGETGTGKELLARAIHFASKRQDAVLVRVNCGALPVNLIESELFGHEKGAFTGATAQRKGRFELAHNGTLFLDEIGELSLEMQVKLLRVLQEQEFERVGGSETLRTNARIIAATNKQLLEKVQAETFRADLFYRLNIFPINVPALRDRREDIPLLARHFLRKFAARFGKSIDRITEGALQRLANYDWPGNVRELANIMERATILCQGRALQENHLSGLQADAGAADGFPTLEELERRHIALALQQTQGVLAGPNGAARLLGINRSTLWSRMQRLRIAKPRS